MVVSSSLTLETGSSPDGVDGCDGGDGGGAAAGSAAVEVAASDAGAPDVQYNSGAAPEP